MMSHIISIYSTCYKINLLRMNMMMSQIISRYFIKRSSADLSRMNNPIFQEYIAFGTYSQKLLLLGHNPFPTTSLKARTKNQLSILSSSQQIAAYVRPRNTTYAFRCTRGAGNNGKQQWTLMVGTILIFLDVSRCTMSILYLFSVKNILYF